MKIPNLETNVKYAAVFINISQLEQTSQNHEQLIVVVMISFWGISLIASVYLARVSVKPLLESIQKQKSFVENASHELRTPLAVLQNRLETLFRKPEATIMESSESIASSLDEVRNMKMLTTNLLNLARRDDGIKPEIGDVEPNFFNTTFTNYEMVAAENGKTFRFDNRIHRMIKTDKTLLKQLMTILFDNALKYSTSQTLLIKNGITGNDNFIIVQDKGPGIPEELQKSLFQPFQRGEYAKNINPEGCGLGLSVVKAIMCAHGGDVSYSLTPENGSLFKLSWPV